MLDTETDLILKLAAAFLCGGIVGLEREMTGKVAGLRTCILVCVGAAIFTLVSMEMAARFGGDPTRIAAQIVTGVGFLGAGAILREFGRGVTGLTTAAIIWTMAAIGMMIGSGVILSAVGVSLLVVLCMYFLSQFEEWLHNRLSRKFRLTVVNKGNELDRVQSLMTIYKINIHGLSIENEEGPETTVLFRFAGANTEEHDFLKLLHDIEGVHIRSNDE